MPNPLTPSHRRIGRHIAPALLVAVAGLAPLLPAGGRAQTPERAQPRLPQVELAAGIHLIKAELATDSGTRARGLMFRERLGPNEGMLFVFPEKSRQCFWMRNTLVPLSIAFLDDDGAVANIADMQPRSDDSHCSVHAIRYALEMEQGWFAKRGITAGSRLRGPPGMFAPR
ncbi:MAG: DUF192 domain-containing protein [Burkholderiaceae bacterium]|nr:DUF192 domain-containing protein [Burkholderiaceae bacterium]